MMLLFVAAVGRVMLLTALALFLTVVLFTVVGVALALLGLTGWPLAIADVLIYAVIVFVWGTAHESGPGNDRALHR